MSGKEYYSLLRTSGGLALQYQDLIESDFAASNGSAYSPPEAGTFRRINVSRCIQILADAPGILETFQTSSAELRLPANTITVLTDDAGNGRLFFIKNSGVGNLVIKDYLGVTLFTLYNGIHIIVTGNQNNNWDFYFTASNIYFDPTGTPYTSTNVRDVILEINNGNTNSASPGFTWGKSGNVGSGTWLLNDTISSDLVGRNFPLYNGSLDKISVSNELASTFTISVYEHDHTTYTLLSSLSLTSQIRKSALITGVSVSYDKELAVRVTSGSCKNVVVQLILSGTLT